MRKVLVVEDERAIRKFIKVNLERENYKVLEAESGEKAIEIAAREEIDVVVLDLMLPGIGGYRVCEHFREYKKDIGIIMLTAKSQDLDKIKGLESGADDYMTKPFNPKELNLRIQSLLRRIPESKSKGSEIRLGPFSLKNYSKSFYKSGLEIKLTPTEYRLVKLFMENPGRVFSRNQLLDLVWDYDYIGDTKIVDVNIRRLRSKIEDQPGDPLYIETVWGVGYRWKKLTD